MMDPEGIHLSLPVNGCPFCNIVQGKSSSDYDRMLVELDHVMLVPALGMFTPGYLLLVTRHHLRSFASLESSQLARVGKWLRELLMRLGSEFGAYFSFEHGMGTGHTTSGACIDHAHIHLIPVTGAAQQIQAALPWRRLATFEELADWRGKPYSYLAFGDKQLISPSPMLPGQWVRRLTAGVLGVTTWDWAAYSGDLELADTLRRLPQLHTL